MPVLFFASYPHILLLTFALHILCLYLSPLSTNHQLALKLPQQHTLLEQKKHPERGY